MKIASAFVMMFLLTAGVRAQQHEPVFINDAPPGFLHIRTVINEGWTEDRYLPVDKVTSVSLVELRSLCRVRINTQDATNSGGDQPLSISLPQQPRKEAETLLLQILKLMERK